MTKSTTYPRISVYWESLTIERARRAARRMRTWRGYLATLEAGLKAGVFQ